MQQPQPSTGLGAPPLPGGEVIDVAVPGGDLAVELIEGGTEPVLAVHGISSQRKVWHWLRAAMPDLSLIAPDLRGRGDSVGIAGPSSIARHAADLLAVLDHAGVDAVHICGMSMGGFVAVELAVAAPARVKSLTLVDGGFPMSGPAGLTPEVLPAVFADRLARLDRDWSTLAEYAEFFVASTAPLLDPADPLLLDYLRHDLAGNRVRLSAEAVIEDATDVFFGPSQWRQVAVPTWLLTAQWAAGRDTPPAYPAEAVAKLTAELSGVLTARSLPGVDHAASIMSPVGAQATAALLAEALQ
jgi:pimeloyl-ACP methyl ester carboxylesterase